MNTRGYSILAMMKATVTESSSFPISFLPTPMTSRCHTFLSIFINFIHFIFRGFLFIKFTKEGKDSLTQSVWHKMNVQDISNLMEAFGKQKESDKDFHEADYTFWVIFGVQANLEVSSLFISGKRFPFLY